MPVASAVTSPSASTRASAKILRPSRMPQLERLDDWSEAALEAQVRAFAEAEDCKLGQIAQPLRAALSGSHASPGIFEVMAVLGRSESLARISDQQTAS